MHTKLQHIYLWLQYTGRSSKLQNWIMAVQDRIRSHDYKFTNRQLTIVKLNEISKVKGSVVSFLIVSNAISIAGINPLISLNTPTLRATLELEFTPVDRVRPRNKINVIPVTTNLIVVVAIAYGTLNTYNHWVTGHGIYFNPFIILTSHVINTYTYIWVMIYIRHDLYIIHGFSHSYRNTDTLADTQIFK